MEQVIHLSSNTVMKELKKPYFAQVQHLAPEHVEVEVCRAEELAQRAG